MKAVLPDMRCEICGEKARGVCPRCYRFVCGKCVDPVTLECVDCTSVKRVIEDDLIRYVDSLSRKLEFMDANMSSCFSCPLYRDSVMSCVRRVKELENVAKLDSYESLYEKVRELKEKAQQLAVKYLIKIRTSE